MPKDSDDRTSVSTMPRDAPLDAEPRAQQKSNRRTLVGQICGSDLYLEEWLSPGEPGHYRRYEIECRCGSHDTDRPCKKRRNIGHAQTKVLGDVEPKAFLGAWLELGSDKVTRENHRGFHPTMKDIRDFARRHGMA